MRKPHRFNLLIVHGDGTRVLRLNLPRWILYGGLTVLALAISTLGAIYGDYISLKRQFSHVAALQQQVVEQQTLIDSFHRRIAEVRSEVSTRRGLPPWPGAPESHSGIDIASERGTPVKAPAPGTIVFAGAQAEYGNTVILDHGHDIKSLYGHLQKIHLTQGQRVERGQALGFF